VVQLVEALCYKLEGCGFNSQWGHWDFYVLNPSGCTMALGSTEPLTDEYQGSFLGVKVSGA
jgi:hypothetical protein